jgi:BirA family transcriptional regulator, biotin operon repressor / biotin---[acetyl-CoA-carboxylase] ligase
VTTRDDAMRSTRTFLSRSERFGSVASTNDIVRQWLAEGTPEVCMAVADVQTAGRGRSGRSWVAPSGAALLLSIGFRPAYLPADRLWRLGATVAMAMADAAEEAAGLGMGSIKLKWPNDLVVADRTAGPGCRKLAGVLGESEGAGTSDVRAIVGIGTNVDWARADFPIELKDVMTSLGELARGRPVDSGGLLDAFLIRLEGRVEALREGYFDVEGWHARQITTGRTIRVDMPDGTSIHARAVGVDGVTGGLSIDDGTGTGERELLAGEVVHVRLASGQAADDEDAAAAAPASAGHAAGSAPGVTS